MTQIIGSCNPDVHKTIQKITRNWPILKWTATVEGSFKVLLLAQPSSKLYCIMGVNSSKCQWGLRVGHIFLVLEGVIG